MKKIVKFELNIDDIRGAIADMIQDKYPEVKFSVEDILFFVPTIDKPGFQVTNTVADLNATLTAVEEGKKKGGTVSRKQVPTSSVGQIGSGSESPSS